MDWGIRRLAQEKKRNLLFVGQSKGYQHEAVSPAMVTLYNLGAARGSGIRISAPTARPSPGSRSSGAPRISTPSMPWCSSPMAISIWTTCAEGRSAVVHAQRRQGFIGIHSAAITFLSWPEYGKMIGGYYDGHPWGEFDALLVVEDPGFPGLGHLPSRFTFKDEIYQIRNFARDDVRVLLHLDASQLDLSRKGVHRKDDDFAVSWARNYGKGRVLYNGWAIPWRPGIVRRCSGCGWKW